MSDQENPGADTVYGRRAWSIWLERGQGPTPDYAQGQDAPNDMNDSRVQRDRILEILSQAMPGYVEPLLFRPRFGYDKSALGITDVLPNTDETWQEPNDTPGSGGPSETNSGPRNVMADNLGQV